MVQPVTQLGQQSNLTSQLDSNLVLSMTTKTAQHTPPNSKGIDPHGKRKSNLSKDSNTKGNQGT
jgi:hypothetical protein